jgi:peptidyl-prolyl cis-trans isomerase D
MFDFFRKYNKIVMIFLFLLIIPSFVLFGVERYQGDQKDEKVARVDGHDITQAGVGHAAPQRGRPHPPAVAQRRPGPARFRCRATPRWNAWCATACWPLRPRRRNMTVSEERLSRMFAQDPVWRLPHAGRQVRSRAPSSA